MRLYHCHAPGAPVRVVDVPDDIGPCIGLGSRCPCGQTINLRDDARRIYTCSGQVDHAFPDRWHEVVAGDDGWAVILQHDATGYVATFEFQLDAPG